MARSQAAAATAATVAAMNGTSEAADGLCVGGAVDGDDGGMRPFENESCRWDSYIRLRRRSVAGVEIVCVEKFGGFAPLCGDGELASSRGADRGRVFSELGCRLRLR